MVKEQSARGTQWFFRGAIILASFALPTVAVAQSGKGYLFEQPNGSFTMRAGYEAARTSSEGFDVLKRETTLGPRSFDAFNLGFDLNYFLNRYVDLTLGLDVSSRQNTSEYRDWDENGAPITHQSKLDRVALGGGFRYNLTSRGRPISSLAFIPAKTIPYVGATGGVLWYSFEQKGDFVEVVNDTIGNIFNDELRSHHYGMMGQAFAGIERRLNARWSLVGESRYTHSASRFTKDYAGLGEIQLSGVAFSLGATVRY